MLYILCQGFQCLDIIKYVLFGSIEFVERKESFKEYEWRKSQSIMKINYLLGIPEQAINGRRRN